MSKDFSSLILGKGEIGKALFSVLKDANYEVEILDRGMRLKRTFDIIHICFPFSRNFIREVRRYQRLYQPSYTIIHSTVPVGTSRKLKAIHSPVRGRHPFLVEGLKSYLKFLSGSQASEVADYFRRAGFRIYLTDKTETTELMKILENFIYALGIEFIKEVKRIFTSLNLPFEAFTLWNQDGNRTLKDLKVEEFVKINLVPIKTSQGGHCTQENTMFFHELSKNPLAIYVLSGGLKLRKGEDPLKNRVWLYAEYIGKRKSSAQIAKEINRKKNEVLDMLKRFNIPIRDKRWLQKEISKIKAIVEKNV